MKFIVRNTSCGVPKSLWLQKILNIMRCVVLFLLLSTLQSVANIAYSQSVRLSLDMHNSTVREVLSAIEQKSSFYFTYNLEQVNVNRRVSVNMKEKSVTDILDNIFVNEGIRYVVNDKHIVLYKAENGSLSVVQASRIVQGRVVDENGEPIIGANIIEKGTTNGVITDMNGNFSMEVNRGAVLQISYIGYETIEVSSNQNLSKIQLREDNQVIDEVVVVGYGIQKKVNLTGAVSDVKSDLLQNRTSSSPVNLLTGQVPGMTIIQRSGQPGDDIGSLRVRGIGTLGNAEAMVIVDGVESSFSNVNPNDIENISVLKDAASSSIYGVRAANGVILITTKKGVVGRPVISYNGYVGWQSPTQLPNYLDSYNYAVLQNEAYANDGLPVPYSETDLQKFKDGSDPDHYPNSDWLGTLLSENGLFHNHHLSMIGGTESLKYSLAVGYHNKEGLIPNSDYNKFSVRSNIDLKVNERLNIGFYLSAYRDRSTSPAAYSAGDIFYHALRETPVTPIQFQNGNYGLFLNEHNSVAEARLGGKDQNYNNNFQGSSFFEYKIIDGLTLKGNAAATFNSNNQHKFARSINFYSAESEDPIRTTRSQAIDFEKKSWEVNLQAYLNYSKTFGKHGVGALLGYSQLYNQYRQFGASRKDLPGNNNLGEVNAGDVTTQSNEGNMIEYALRSAFGRINYSFDDRYLFEANLRYDGTSRFPKNNRFGAFPSFSAGWRISEESFYHADWMDNLKLRASWGQLGNQEIGNYAFYNTYIFGQNYSFGNMLTPGVSINGKMGNSIITWEKTDQVDLGVDASFLAGKLTFSGDFFLKNTKDILLDLPIPDVVGVDAPTQNAGKVRNIGMEMVVTHNNQIRDFKYFATFNFSYVHNEITDLKEGDTPGRSVGDPINNIYGYVCEGIFRDQAEIDAHPKQITGDVVPGDLKYKDLNGDGIVDDKDRKSLGTYFPKINFGLRLGFEYKNFDFSALLQGAGMVDAIAREQVIYAFYNGGKVVENYLDRWTPQNPNGKYPRLSMQNTQKNWETSSFWMQNASYLKMRNMQLGYTIPKQVLGKSGISNLRIYFSVDNLFTISGFDNLDPEVPYGTYYPLTKNYSFGVNVSF
ncbi:TonB-dependent receptor [Parabacteroides johnsonii]|uniref:TonB-dependent receptor n=1 Tax=Parabacteroides johnsonii TaxID=387661 RepID=UPI003966D0BE